MLAPCDGGEWQRFDVIDHGGGVYSFRSRTNNECLRSRSSGLRLSGCGSYNNSRRFTF